MQRLPTNKIAVGYCRVSTDMQVKEGHSLETQQNVIMEYCIRSKMRFSRFYIEEGKSGKNMQRPKILEMLGELQPFLVVIATAVSRISRSVKDLQTIIETINSKGATQ
jgi:site-specific DNA recombinase